MGRSRPGPDYSPDPYSGAADVGRNLSNDERTMQIRKPISNGLRRARGVTLIELMIALSIGSFLMIGAVTVFVQSRTVFRVTESVSRIQENARFVLDALGPDIRMASYFGLTSRSNKVQGRATAFEPTPPGLGVGSDCGPNWSISVTEEVGGSNNGYAWDCAAFGGVPAPTADTFVVRRASQAAIAGALTDGTLYLQSARFQDSQIFVGTAGPARLSSSDVANIPRRR
ncbi:MAG: PilW family protein [Candidatus Rariloculaceae bacterium]